jgi:hypothetical protein
VRRLQRRGLRGFLDFFITAEQNAGRQYENANEDSSHLSSVRRRREALTTHFAHPAGRPILLSLLNGVNHAIRGIG